MKLKIILFSLLLTFCGKEAFGGHIDGPDLSDWDGQSNIGKWVPKLKKEKFPGKIKWIPIRAWLLDERKEEEGKYCTNGRDDSPLHCIFQSEDGKCKVSFMMEVEKDRNSKDFINPEDYRFVADKEFDLTSPYFKKGKNGRKDVRGHKFQLKGITKGQKPLENVPSYINKFPKGLFQDIREQEKSE